MRRFSRRDLNGSKVRQFYIENHPPRFAIFNSGGAHKLTVAKFLTRKNFVIATDSTNFYEKNITKRHSVFAAKEKQLPIYAIKPTSICVTRLTGEAGLARKVILLEAPNGAVGRKVRENSLVAQLNPVRNRALLIEPAIELSA